MQFSRIDLSTVKAISHDDENLGLVIDRGDRIDVIEVPAPLAAYEGLQLLNAIANSDTSLLIEEANFNHLPGNSIPMLSVQSGMAKSVGYDPHHNVLQVEFKNGSVYQFDDVNECTWDELQTTDSPGKFFNREIKGIYRSRRLH